MAAPITASNSPSEPEKSESNNDPVKPNVKRFDRFLQNYEFVRIKKSELY